MVQGHIELTRSGKSLTVVRRVKACACRNTSASGPRYIYSIDTGPHTSVWRLKWIALACDTCNTPWDVAQGRASEFYESRKGKP